MELNKISLFQQFAEVKKQTVFCLQTAEVWSTSSAADVCRYGPQTANVLPLKKQSAPECNIHDNRMLLHNENVLQHVNSSGPHFSES
ncbi:hypothetical protein Hanom_Chr01g00093651 [Helianthus anomalus]